MWYELDCKLRWGKIENCKKRGVKLRSGKDHVWLTTRTGYLGNRSPKNTSESMKKGRRIVRMLQKKRRNLRGKGSREEMKGVCYD